jgi:hypothetical protein
MVCAPMILLGSVNVFQGILEVTVLKGFVLLRKHGLIFPVSIILHMLTSPSVQIWYTLYFNFYY